MTVRSSFQAHGGRRGRIDPASDPGPDLDPFENARPDGIASFSLRLAEIEYLRAMLSGLTSRERDVVLALCRGGSNEGIADRMCVALPTLRTHLMRVNQKLGTQSKGEVVSLIASTLLHGYRSGHLASKASENPA